MTLEYLIHQTGHLTPVEAEISAYILEHLDRIPQLSIADLAAGTSTSKSAVHRFCKKIGFDGFNDLKVAAARDLAEARSTARIDVNYPFGETDGPQPIAQKLAKLYESAIQDTFRQMDFIQVQRVARVLNKASGIDIYTHAHNMNVAENFQDKMLTIGKRVNCPHGFYNQRAGGMFKAFRTIPVIGQIIQDMKELCPNAWLINFTNPSGMVTEAAIKHFGWKKCIGLCNVPTIAMMAEPKLLGKDPKDLNYRFAGLNHFHWHKVFDQDGNDLTPRMIDHINDRDSGTPANIFQADFPLELLHSMNLLPCGYHRYYYMKQAMLDHAIQDFKEGGTRAEQVKQTEHELFELYKNTELHVKPPQLSKRDGAYYSDAACECIRAIYGNKKIHMVVSTQNNGAIPCLADDSIVEVSSIISANGAQPLAWGKLPPAEKGWLQMMKAMEECTIQAALTGDYGLALEAFVLNPLVEKQPGYPAGPGRAAGGPRKIPAPVPRQDSGAESQRHPLRRPGGDGPDGERPLTRSRAHPGIKWFSLYAAAAGSEAKGHRKLRCAK